MPNRFRPRLALALALLLIPVVPAAAQLTNPDFDAGIADWAKFAGTDATPSWDGSVGSPLPGSAYVTSPAAPAFTQFPGISQCFPASPGDAVSVAARVLADLRAGDQCFVELGFFDCEACVCAALDSGIDVTVGSTDGWDTLVDSEVAPAGTVAASISLKMRNEPTSIGGAGVAGAASTCRWDSARVYAGEVVLADDFEHYPIEAWSSVLPADCSGFCGNPSPIGCYCDEACLGKGDCCPDACLTCGHCP